MVDIIKKSQQVNKKPPINARNEPDTVFGEFSPFNNIIKNTQRGGPISGVSGPSSSSSTGVGGGASAPSGPPPPPPNPAETCTDPGCAASRFDGINDSADADDDFIGNASSKLGMVSFWAFFRNDSVIGPQEERILDSRNNGLHIFRTHRTTPIVADDQNKIVIQGFGGSIFELEIYTTTALIGGGWHHFLASWDLSNATSGRIYVDDSSDYSEVTFNNVAIFYPSANGYTFGAKVSGGDVATRRSNMDLSEFYANFAEYLDFNIEANRRKFITAGLAPVDLGADGSTPTGTPPIIYYPKGDPTDNKGSGDRNMTVFGAIELVAGPGA